MNPNLGNFNPKPKPEKPEKEKRKYRKKNPRQKIEIELDKVLKDIVLARDPLCVCTPTSGHYGVATPGHLITRGKESIKWDLRNVHNQCQGCNGRHEHYSHYFTDWFLLRFGVEVYHQLCLDGERVKKLQMYELEELLEQLKRIRQRQLEDKNFKPYFTQKDILSGAWNND